MKTNTITFLAFLIGSFAVLAQGATYTTNCPTGINNNYRATCFQSGTSLVSSAASGATVTAASTAEQCCYICRAQTSVKCTTWTFDGCGFCYLSGATCVNLFHKYIIFRLLLMIFKSLLLVVELII